MHEYRWRWRRGRGRGQRSPNPGAQLPGDVGISSVMLNNLEGGTRPPSTDAR